MKSINVLIEFLLKAKIKEIKRLSKSVDDTIEVIKVYKKDIVAESDLINLLRRSIKHKVIQYFLIDIFFFIEENSITDSVFEMCLNYPGRFRKTLVVQLSHVCKKEEQLKKLNLLSDDSEAFYRLFLKYLFDEKISSEQLYQFLFDNKEKLGYIQDYTENLGDKNLDENKIDIIEKILNQEKVKKLKLI